MNKETIDIIERLSHKGFLILLSKCDFDINIWFVEINGEQYFDLDINKIFRNAEQDFL